MKILLTLFFLLFTNSVNAEWTKVTESENGFSIHYLDYDTLKKINGNIRIWELVSYPYKLLEDYEVYSAKNLILFDCENEKFKYLTNVYFNDLKGEGEVIFTEDVESKWYFDPPGSVGYIELEIVCKF